jgi:hypothetical protein
VLQLEEAQKETKPFITDLIERNGKETIWRIKRGYYEFI